MALRARLVAPPPAPKTEWIWHKTKSSSIPVSAMWSGDRRMEAGTFLSSGYGFRTAIEAKKKGWKRFGEVARVWQPSRLKGIQVSREFGTPFVAATQAFDVRPIPRKWLSLDRTDDAANRFVEPGTILVTCSGSVGRPTLAYQAHEGILISHDLLRVSALEYAQRGWIYAYLLASQVRAMAKGAHYGHIIKHLETSHLQEMPIPEIEVSEAEALATKSDQIIRLRNEGYRLALEAEDLFEKTIGRITVSDWGESGFSVKASSFLGLRRRIDASIHNPGVQVIRKHLARNGKGFTTIQGAGFSVWVPGRYKRIPAEDGVVYRDSADLLEMSPDLGKRFADCGFGDEFRGRVKSGWILIPCSGQTYGIIGTALLATEALDDQVVSNHVIRIAPIKNTVPTGYVVTALSHPVFGRPLVKALAFGSSIPEIDPEDLGRFELVRLASEVEDQIDALANASYKARAEADILERELASRGTEIVDRFILHS